MLAINTYANTFFSCTSSFISEIMLSMLQYLKKKCVWLIKEKRCFSCKKKSYIIYYYLRKGKITAISENISKNSDNQGKE